MGWFGVWFGAGRDNSDSVVPTVSLVSPTEFDDDYDIASVTPVVFEITDALPGLRTATVFVTGPGFEGVQAAYYNDALVTPFTSDSTVTAITGGLSFSLLPANGWSPGTLTIIVEAVDQDGNHILESFDWLIPLPAAIASAAEGNAGYPFRDSTWRWKRRLNKQKCSVVSVAIEDSGSDGPGFVLTALALEIRRKSGLDRIPWRGGTVTNRAGTHDINDGTE